MMTTSLRLRSTFSISVVLMMALMTSGGMASAQIVDMPEMVKVSSPLIPGEVVLDGAGVKLTIDQAAMNALKPARRAIIERFPIAPNLSVTLDLKRIEPFTDDAQLVVASMERGRIVERALQRPDAVFFGGRIAGVENSQAFLALTSTGHNGWVRFNDRMFFISSGPYGENRPLIAFDLAAMPDGALRFGDHACLTDALPQLPPNPDAPSGGGEGGLAGSGDGAPCREVRVAIETDYEFTFNRFSGNPIASGNYAATIMAACNFIYARDINVRLPVSYLRLWTTPNDPWTQTGASSQLSQFRTYWNANMASVPRTLAHMFSARGLGGGVAWVNVLCESSYGYAFSGSLNGFFPYPLQNNSSQNWDIMVVAHEAGHNFSSPHTHSYNPIIDGCGSNPQNCENANQGTIMSYCHTCSGGMSNIVIDLHPTVEAYILNTLANSSCNFLGSSLPPVPVEDRAFVAEGASVTIDVLANDLEMNCDSAVIDSHAASSPAGGLIALSSGTGPGGRDQLSYTAPVGFNGMDSFAYSIRDGANVVRSANVNVRVYGFRDADAPARFQSGIRGRFYPLTTPSALPDFSVIPPTVSLTATTLNYSSTSGAFGGSGLFDNFGALYTGWVNVPATGLYTMYLESDDGSRMYVGDEIVINNDGRHGMIERSGLVGLQAGRHKVRIEFFEYTGGAGLKASYSGPGLAKQIIPAANWSRALPSDVNEDGAVNVSDLLSVISQWGSCSENTLGCGADTDGNGNIDVTDLLNVISNWG